MQRGGKSKREAGYGQGKARIAFDDDVLLDEEALTSRLLGVFGAPDYQPPTLPSVATELMALSARPDVGVADVVGVLERDAMLTGRVMKLVRSPVYASGCEIPTVENAVVRLGLNTLRDIVLETCMNMRVFRADTFTDTMERLRRHSTATGHLARIVCKYTSVPGEFAFLCGLLHDVGIAGSLIALCDGIPKQKRPDLISIWPAVDRAHAQAGTLMTRLWELPMDVQLAAGHHHQVAIEGMDHPLSAVVCIADDLAHEMGFDLASGTDVGDVGNENELASACLQSHHAIDHSTEGTRTRALRALGLEDAQMDLIRSDAANVAEKLG